MPRYRSRLASHASIVLCAIAAGAVAAQAPEPPAQATKPTATAAGPAAQAAGPAARSSGPSEKAGAPQAHGAPSATTAPAPISADKIIPALDETVDWYRTLGIQEQAATEPSDWSIYYENRQIAIQVIGLAFQAARAAADLIDRQQPAAAPAAADAPVSSQALAAAREKFEAQGKQVQAELDSEQALLSKASAKPKREAQEKIAELRAELNLIDTKKDVLASITSVVKGAEAAGAHALRARIEAMAVASPAANAALPAAGAAPSSTGGAASTSIPSTAAAPATRPASPRSGLWDLGANVFKLSDKSGTVASIDERTRALQKTLTQIRAPLIDQMRALSARSDALIAQAGSAGGAAFDGEHDQVKELAAQFRQIAAILIPTDQQITLLNQYRRNLASWHIVVESQSRNAMKALAIRLGVLLGILVVVFALAELARRTVLGYVQDMQRRHQLVLISRIVHWSLVAVIVGFAFVGELGSVATFAGLLTAGVALAMQSVLVSIVGYFFLIGKHGIRIGDRVQIGQVTGEVIDLGLLRMYLVELGGAGSPGPTGRVVAFANSVVFQVTSGLFKQIPGVDLFWHEITLNVPPDADPAAIKTQLLAAALEALEDYREEIERQSREIRRATASSYGGDTVPTVRLKFSAGGVVAQVRYPVHLQNAADIDERMWHALLKVMPTGSTAAGDA